MRITSTLLLVLAIALTQSGSPASAALGGPAADPGPVEAIDVCGGKQLMFDGQCRKPGYFGRFLASGATMVGVMGSQDLTDDEGVVVVESLDELMRFRYVRSWSADRMPLAPAAGGYLVAGVESVHYWTDELDRLNSARFLETPSWSVTEGAWVLTAVDWSTQVYSGGGYTSCGPSGCSIHMSAGGGGGSYCDKMSSMLGSVVGGGCEVGAGYSNQSMTAIAATAPVILIKTGTPQGMGIAALLGAVAGELDGWTSFVMGVCAAMGDLGAALAKAGCDISPLDPAAPLDLQQLLSHAGPALAAPYGATCEDVGKLEVCGVEVCIEGRAYEVDGFDDDATYEIVVESDYCYDAGGCFCVSG